MPTTHTTRKPPDLSRVRPQVRPTRARAGFTLLELLVVLAMISVLAGLGFTSLPRDRFAAREAARVLAADLNRARSEAVRLNTNVALQFGGSDCGDYCLYTDFARSGAPDGNVDGDVGGTIELANPVLLRRTAANDFPRATLTASGFGSSARIWFDVRGLPRISTGAYLGSTASVTIRPAGGDPGFLVTLEPQGRIQVASE